MGPKNHVFLMYCGYGSDGRDYRKWDADEVEPLIVYRNGEITDSFFPAFLLLAIKSKKGGSLIPGFGAPGNKNDWLAWLDDIFLPGHNLEAIAQTVNTHQTPAVDIWVSLPYPDPGQKKFGLVGDRRLNFSRNEDRALALKWWINRFLARWHGKIKVKGLERHIFFRGFYWARETMTAKDRLLLPRLISHIHYLGCLTMWIPYYAATAFLNITNPGFHITVIQPSYWQNPALGVQRLSAAAARAKKYGAGIEIEFDTSALDEKSPGYKIALDYLNRGLPQYEGYMLQSFTAYYTGYKTVPGLYKNKNPLYTHLYRFVKGTLAKIEYPGN